MVLIKNAVDSFTNEGAASKNYGSKARLQVSAASSNRKYAWLFFTRPWPPGATILSAKLRLYSGTTFSGSTTISAQRANAKWGVNKITWSNQPGATGATAAVTKTDAAAGTEWELDVQSIVQAIADGANWYGLRVSTNNTGANWFHSQQSTTGSFRPVLDVTWTVPPDAPEGLSPGGGLAMSLDKPIVRCNYVDDDGMGANSLAAMQVQIDAADVWTSGIDFDSGEVATTFPQVDLAATAYAGLAVDATTYWRCRVKNASGIWSAWSESTSFVRKSKGTLTITSPAASPNNKLWDGSPVITWTFSGTTQRAYQVIIAMADNSSNWVWDSGKITSTATSVNVPFGAIVDATLNYQVIVRIWDTVNRESVPNDPVYVEASREWTFAYDPTVAEVTSLNAASDSVLPKMVLTWNRSAQPTHWQIQRSDDNVTWKYIDEELGADLFVSGTSYRYEDLTCPSYQQYYWRVLAVVSGVQSDDNPTVGGQIRRLAPTLIKKDGTSPVILANANKTRQNLDTQAVVDTLGSSPPIVITQKIGGLTGHVDGTLADDFAPGLTAKQMAANLEAMRQSPGVPVVFANLDETYKAVIFNVQSQPRGGGGNKLVYDVSFDWVVSA